VICGAITIACMAMLITRLRSIGAAEFPALEAID
jgi:hypothetical protein